MYGFSRGSNTFGTANNTDGRALANHSDVVVRGRPIPGSGRWAWFFPPDVQPVC